jgi:lysophospholipase L1-like esterase
MRPLIAVLILCSLASAQRRGAQQVTHSAAKWTIQRPAVLVGDSITLGFRTPAFLPGWWIANDGRGGDTLTMMLARFGAEVQPLNPHIVIINGGTNDIGPGSGCSNSTPEQLRDRFVSLVQATQIIGATPIIATIIPMRGTHCFENHLTIAPANELIKAWALANKVQVFDYYAVLLDPATGGMADKYANPNPSGTNGLDDFHPGPAGYIAIAPMVDAYLRGAFEVGQ